MFILGPEVIVSYIRANCPIMYVWGRYNSEILYNRILWCIFSHLQSMIGITFRLFVGIQLESQIFIFATSLPNDSICCKLHEWHFINKYMFTAVDKRQQEHIVHMHNISYQHPLSSGKDSSSFLMHNTLSARTSVGVWVQQTDVGITHGS